MTTMAGTTVGHAHLENYKRGRQSCTSTCGLPMTFRTALWHKPQHLVLPTTICRIPCRHPWIIMPNLSSALPSLCDAVYDGRGSLSRCSPCCAVPPNNEKGRFHRGMKRTIHWQRFAPERSQPCLWRRLVCADRSVRAAKLRPRRDCYWPDNKPRNGCMCVRHAVSGLKLC